MNNKNVIILVENISKSYGKVKALDSVSFEVYQGEIFGLLGPNGAGKTTLLEIMETLKQQSDGEVKIDGMNTKHRHGDIRKVIGVQLQQAGFYPALKLIEIIKFFASLYNVNVDPEEILSKVGLEAKKNFKTNELSGGQKQRLSLAVALINSPKIIFLDEPTTGLDPQARRSLWDLISEIKERGTTVVLTTHYMDEAEVLCDRIAVIDSGKIIKIDTPENLINNLLLNGFTKKKETKAASLEDVFLDLTGKELRD